MAGAFRWRSKLGLGTANPVTAMMEFMTENLKVNQKLDDLSGTRGTLEMPDARVREVERYVDGEIEFQPGPGELNVLLPLITGDTRVDDTTAMKLVYPLPYFYATVDRDVNVFTYDNCKANVVTITANVGGAMKVKMSVLGFDETKANAGTFPALSPLEEAPYILSDLAMLVNGSSIPITTMTLTMDHGLERQHFNSVIPTRISQTKFDVRWDLDIPAGEGMALYGASAAAAVAVQATFTNGTRSIRFRSETVRAPKETPVINQVPGEIPMKWVGVARKTAAQPDTLKITNDSTA